jgi:mRNA interferase RelE/StbE
MTFQVRLTQDAVAMLEEIQDRRVRAKVFDRIRKLGEDPDKQGKPLVDELSGFRSLRAIGQRYRIVYQVRGDLVEVLVVGAALRKTGSKSDIYARMAKLLGKG